MGPILFFFLLASPFLLMWWMVVARNRVRNMPRGREREEESPAFEAAWTDTVKSADGLNYSRSFSVNEELLTATRRGDEPDDVKNLQGRR
jgi:hypothetical protein